MSSVLLADDFPLPPAIVTESVAIFGRKGSGKTYTGGRLFEQMFGIGAQCVALDPVGNWWGLRLSASGKRTGLTIPVFGGDRGDIPITPAGGKLMAQTIVERNISCVIDLMNFRPSQRKEFAADFAEELYELKKRKRTPLHLFVEEARLFAPQVMKAKLDVRMNDAFEQIVRLGRNYGLGVSLLDQRPQSVNKEVTSQTEVLIAHQMVEHQGRDAIEKWVRSKKTEGADQLEHLDELKCGEAFVWSPGLLRKFARIRVGKKQTYDSSGTPELGKAEVAETKPLSSKDLAALKDAMAEVVEQAQAQDPAHLRKQIADLKRELLEKQNSIEAMAVETRTEVVEVPVVDPELVTQLMDLEQAVSKALAPIGEHVTAAVQALARFTTGVAKRVKNGHTPPAKSYNRPFTPAPNKSPREIVKTIKPITLQKLEEDGGRTGPENRILEALNWFETVGITQPETTAVAFLAGYSPGGGAFANPKGRLRKLGLIDYRGSCLALTDAGRAVAPDVDQPLTTTGLHQAVMARLPGPERKLLTVLINDYPGSVPNEALAEATGYSASGGAYNNPRGRLKSLGLVTYPERGMVRAADLLFLGNDRRPN